MGRRPYLAAAPRPEDLVGRAVHEIVRDFPEALSTLRDRGIDVALVGGKRLSELPGADELARALAVCSAWRPPSSVGGDLERLGVTGEATAGSGDPAAAARG